VSALERPRPRLELAVGDLGDSLQVAAARLRAYCEALEVDEAATYRASLVLEELATNALKYGKLAAGGAVRVAIRLEPGALAIEVRDRGRPFDPTVPRRRRRVRSLEGAPVGGLGLRLVKSATSSLVYHREAGENVVEARVALARP
jgi:anti-sigma regulatory factor (Ser/Thr protein kinase)